MNTSKLSKVQRICLLRRDHSVLIICHPSSYIQIKSYVYWNTICSRNKRRQKAFALPDLLQYPKEKARKLRTIWTTIILHNKFSIMISSAPVCGFGWLVWWYVAPHQNGVYGPTSLLNVSCNVMHCVSTEYIYRFFSVYPLRLQKELINEFRWCNHFQLKFVNSVSWNKTGVLVGQHAVRWLWGIFEFCLPWMKFPLSLNCLAFLLHLLLITTIRNVFFL